MHDDPTDAKLPRQLGGLQKTLPRDLPHQRIDRARAQLRKRRVKPKAVDAAHFFPRLVQRVRVPHARRIAEVRKLKAETVCPRLLCGVLRRCG